MLTYEVVRKLFHYDEERGALIWKETNSNRAVKGAVAGCKRKDGRIQVRVNGKYHFSHQIIWIWMTKKPPIGCVDHINCNPSDNRWGNLRQASIKENCRNKRIGKNNSTGFKGIRFQAKKYEANITVDCKWIYLGRFKTKKEAHQAYCTAARKYYGEFARFS